MVTHNRFECLGGLLRHFDGRLIQTDSDALLFAAQKTDTRTQYRFECFANKALSVAPKAKFGWTPMHYAAESGHVESIRVIHELGALPPLKQMISDGRRC